jgi:[acyl-carrier-protein] S-malonyltransferase
MPRDMAGTGRYPPQPRYPPFAFYSAVRLGDPEMLAKVLAADPYFVTQDNGAGAPLHFAVTYRQLDMVSDAPLPPARRSAVAMWPTWPGGQPRCAPLAQVHHLLSLGAHVNQRDGQGLTPLHRAAYLAHLDGYLELYEYLLVGHLVDSCLC